MEAVFAIIQMLAGALIPSVLLWHKHKECQHLLNIILKREKAPTLDRPFDGIPLSPKVAGEKYQDRKSRPTGIDIVMAKAETLDNEIYLREHPREAAVNG